MTRRVTRVVMLTLALASCGTEPAPVATPAPEPVVEPVATPEVQAHRDAELREWLAVDELIGRCYVEHRGVEPNMVGAVAVRFTIMPDGHAQHVAITQAEPHDVAAEACVVHAVEAMPFTPSPVPVERTIERRFDEP